MTSRAAARAQSQGPGARSAAAVPRPRGSHRRCERGRRRAGSAWSGQRARRTPGPGSGRSPVPVRAGRAGRGRERGDQRGVGPRREGMPERDHVAEPPGEAPCPPRDRRREAAHRHGRRHVPRREHRRRCAAPRPPRGRGPWARGGRRPEIPWDARRNEASSSRVIAATRSRTAPTTWAPSGRGAAGRSRPPRHAAGAPAPGSGTAPPARRPGTRPARPRRRRPAAPRGDPPRPTWSGGTRATSVRLGGGERGPRIGREEAPDRGEERDRRRVGRGHPVQLVRGEALDPGEEPREALRRVAPDKVRDAGARAAAARDRVRAALASRPGPGVAADRGRGRFAFAAPSPTRSRSYRARSEGSASQSWATLIRFARSRAASPSPATSGWCCFSSARQASSIASGEASNADLEACVEVVVRDERGRARPAARRDQAGAGRPPGEERLDVLERSGPSARRWRGS